MGTKSIIIGFSTPRKWHVLPALIKFLEKTDFSHVYIKLKSESIDRELIYQASGLQVNFQNIASFNEKSKVIKEFEIELSEEAYIKVMQYMVDNVGKPYSIRQLLGMGIRKIASYLGCVISNPFKNAHDAFICSEIAADILGLAKNEAYNSENVSPNDLYKVLTYWFYSIIKIYLL